MLFRSGSDVQTWTHTVQNLNQQVLRCAHVNCSCECFLPERLNLRSCDHCKHGWVMHAVSKLCVCSDQVEVVQSGVLCDLSALILFGTHAFPIRIKILLDRLFSVLTHQHVLNILHTHGWTLHDYVRGYKLQGSSGKLLDSWVIMTPEDELMTLCQFLRFGETKSSAELMISQHEQHPLSTNISKLTKHDRFLNTSNLQINGITRGQRSPGLSHFENLPGSIQEHSELSSSRPYKFPSEFCKLQQNRETKQQETVGYEAAVMTNPPLRGREERKNGYGARDRRPCSSSVQKSRVSCNSCRKTFYDKGTLKIHYNAVHLKIKHRCTIKGCDMLFSSLRSRNRHSANPNPRLHNTHYTHSTHSMASHWVSSPSSMSPVKIIQEVKISDTTTVAPVNTSSVYAFANMNNYTEMIDQHKMAVYSANSAGGRASNHLLSNMKECKGDTGAPARKKSRKSTVPVKIERRKCDEHT